MTKGNPNDSSMKLGFVAKVLDDGSYKPIYIAPDSTDKVRGDVYLSDSTSSTSNAATGVTAASPAAVKAANDNANNRLSKTDTNAQTVAGPITFSNTITASKTISGNVSGNAATATKLATARNITVRTNSNSKTDATASFNGSAAITLNLSSIDAGAVNTGTLPLSVIPKGALERLVSVADQTARFKLTTDSVQLGDTVQQTDTGVLYIVVDESNLGNAKGYVEYKAGTALSAQEATHATSADSATKATNDSAGNNINTTYLKGLSVSGTTITYTKGNGSTGTITTKDTTYSTFKGATASAAGNTGLVPAPAKGANTKFLRGDGTWQVAGEVTGVKGDAESSYRVGDVNLTAANVNAISTNTNDSKYGQLTVYPDKNATDNWQYISALTVRSGTGDDVAEIQLRSNSISGDSGLYDSLNNSWVVYVPTDRTDETCYFHGTADRAIAANTAITASAADSLYKTLSLTGDVTGNVSLAGTSSATATLTTVVATNAITTDKVKDKAITNAKLGDDVNTIAVSSTQPTDSRVKIWIKI